MNNVDVVFSEKAYLGIVAETYEKIGTETGGIFLGKKIRNTWFILETIDPGPNSIFQTAYFEYDTPYVNHLSNKVARFYNQSIELVGLWHRHPGNFSRFSSTDDGTNQKYAQLRGDGAISALVNLVPDFQMTVFRVDLPLQYHVVKYIIGDQHIPQELMQQKNVSDFVKRSSTYTAPAGKPLKSGLTPTKKTKKKSGFAIRLFKLIGDIFLMKGTARKQKSNEKAETSQIAESLERLMDMIEVDIDYLTLQSEYDVTIKPQRERLVVVMNYRYSMAEYPQQLSFVFGVSKNRGYVLIGNGRESHPYRPNFIREYINASIMKHGVRS